MNCDIISGLVTYRLERWAYNQEVVGSNPCRVAIKWLPLGWADCLRTDKSSRYMTNRHGQFSFSSSKYVNRVPAYLTQYTTRKNDACADILSSAD